MIGAGASGLARLVPWGRSGQTASSARRCAVPDMSVTIRPSGEAYRLAREVIDALGEQCPGGRCSEAGCTDRACTGFEPHVTLQYIYDVPEADAARVADALEHLYRDA